MFKLWKEGVDGSFANAALMVFEKGGGGMPPPPDPMAEARAQIEIDNAREARAAAQRERDERIAEEKRRKDLQAWTGRRNSTLTDARQYGQEQFGRLGMSGDPYGLLAGYESALSRANRGLAELGDLNALNGEDLWSSVSSNIRTGQRSKFNSQLNQNFGSGFENNMITDEADDPYIDEFLTPQYQESRDAIERSRARGQLNDTAYASALKAIDRQRATGRSKAQTLGQGVLGRYRQQLTGDVGNLRNRIQNWDFSDNLNLDTERVGITNRLNTNMGRLRDDISAALSDQDFFNLENILGRALTAGGTTNDGTGTPGGNPLQSAMATALTEAERRRQLGNAGVF